MILLYKNISTRCRELMKLVPCLDVQDKCANVTFIRFVMNRGHISKGIIYYTTFVNGTKY